MSEIRRRKDGIEIRPREGYYRQAYCVQLLHCWDGIDQGKQDRREKVWDLLYPSEILKYISSPYIDFYHTVKDRRSASDCQSLLECVTAKAIRHYSDLVLHERSEDLPEGHTYPSKRSDIGLNQKLRQKEPYFRRKIYLD